MGNLEQPRKLSQKEELEKKHEQRIRETRIGRTRAALVKRQVLDAYEILENIRFDYIGDTAFRDHWVRAKNGLESMINDFLLSDNYHEMIIKKIQDMTPKESDGTNFRVSSKD